MAVTPASFQFDPDVSAAIDRAAADQGLAPADWLRATVTEQLRRAGYLPELDDALRPDQLNANNDG